MLFFFFFLALCVWILDRIRCTSPSPNLEFIPSWVTFPFTWHAADTFCFLMALLTVWMPCSMSLAESQQDRLGFYLLHWHSFQWLMAHGDKVLCHSSQKQSGKETSQVPKCIATALSLNVGIKSQHSQECLQLLLVALGSDFNYNEATRLDLDLDDIDHI